MIQSQLSEVWKVFCHCQKYEISNQGRVRHIRLGRLLSTPKINTGYKTFSYVLDKIVHRTFVHRAVLETFVGLCPDGMQGSHLNGDRHDNRLSNLVWESMSKNQLRKNNHGTMSRLKGELHGQSKLNAQQVIEIRNTTIDEINTKTVIAARYGVTAMTIHDILTGKSWKHLLKTVPNQNKNRKEEMVA